MSSFPPWLTEIDHTGDIGIRVAAPTVPAIFERAAEGTFHVLTDLAAVRPTTETTLTVRAPDREALLVRWLSELNYRHTVEHTLYSTFAVERLDEDGDELVLTATVRGEPIDPARHVVHTEIKAITFHGLAVRPTDEGWTVQIIFDM